MDALKNTPDLDLIVGRMRRSNKSNKSRATLMDVYRMYQFSIKNLPCFLQAMDSFLEQVNDDKTSQMVNSLKEKFSLPLRQCDTDMKSFKQLVEHVLDFESLPELHIKVHTETLDR